MADINLKDFKPNSNASKEAEKPPVKKVNSVVSTKAKIVKKGAVRRFFSNFVADDPTTVKTSIISGVIVPEIKKMIDDIVHSLLYPGGGPSRKSDRSSKVSYRSYYDSKDDYPRETERPMPRNILDYDDVIFDTRGNAEAVIDGMMEIIERYKVVSVADFYDLAEIDETNYTANKYGWTDIHNAQVIRLGRDKYKIRLPKAMPID